MDELFPLSDYMIRVLALLGSWLAGIGSLAAVITSLWLARRSEKPHLSVKVHMKGFGATDPHNRPRWVFSIINTGFRSVTVESLGWRWRERLRNQICWEPFFHGRVLPRTLEPGDHADIEAGPIKFADMVELLQSRKRVWAVVGTAIGRVTVPVNPSLRRYLRGHRTRKTLEPDSVVESNSAEDPNADPDERHNGASGGESKK